MKMNLNLYMVVPSTESLGPGKRFVIWVQGCNKRCKGCIAADAWDTTGGINTDVGDLAEQIIEQKNIEGITISGGEPFLQQQPLVELVHQIRRMNDLGVIIYTGMKYEEIKDTELAQCADLIIDGEYVEDLNDNKSLRGSSNQNVICLTDRYKSIAAKYFGQPGRKIELIISDDETRIVGIPSRSLSEMIGD